MEDLTPEELEAVRQVLASRTVQLLIGAEEWELSEETEMDLWSAIEKLGVNAYK